MGQTLRKSILMKIIADESEKTKKARAKLKEKLDKTDKKLTQEALLKKSHEIAGWIERHASDRVSVKKEISLFDQNRNSAKISPAIEKMVEELKTDIQ